MQIVWMVAALTFALDRATKALTVARLALGARVEALPHLLTLWHTRNTGVAFGMLAQSRLLALALSLATIALLFFLLRKSEKTPLLMTAQGLILGGFAGNLLDRLLAGAVTDMLYFPWLPFFVCNVADVAICAGVAALGFASLKRPPRRKEA